MAAKTPPPPEPIVHTDLCPEPARPGREMRPEDVTKPDESWMEGKDLVKPTHPGARTVTDGTVPGVS